MKSQSAVLQIEDDPTGGKYAAVSSILNGAPHKLENIIQFHVGDMVTSLQRAVMQPGGQESIIYGTVMGGIGEPCPACRRLPATGGLDCVPAVIVSLFWGCAH